MVGEMIRARGVWDGVAFGAGARGAHLDAASRLPRRSPPPQPPLREVVALRPRGRCEQVRRRSSVRSVPRRLLHSCARSRSRSRCRRRRRLRPPLERLQPSGWARRPLPAASRKPHGRVTAHAARARPARLGPRRARARSVPAPAPALVREPLKG